MIDFKIKKGRICLRSIALNEKHLVLTGSRKFIASQVRQGIEYFDYNVIELDFYFLESASYSALKDCLIELRMAIKYKDLFFYITNLNTKAYIYVDLKNACDNLDMSFAWSNESTVSMGLLGNHSDKYLAAFNLISKHGQMTSSKLAELTGESVQACSVRLSRMNHKGLIRKIKVSAESGGYEYIYHHFCHDYMYR